MNENKLLRVARSKTMANELEYKILFRVKRQRLRAQNNGKITTASIVDSRTANIVADN